jgi:hypothetical protein
MVIYVQIPKPKLRVLLFSALAFANVAAVAQSFAQRDYMTALASRDSVPRQLSYVEKGGLSHIYIWEFQDPKMEVPTIYKAYVRPM